MTRARKGEVKVSAHKTGALRLTWSYQGKRYELRPGLHDTPENRLFAEGTAKQIEMDMKSEHFDPTLNKYRSQVNLPEKKNITAIALFDKYFEFRRSDLAIGTQKKYEALRNQLFAQLKNKPATLKLDDVLKVKNWLSENFASVTAKDKICILQAAWTWGMKRKLVNENPWEGIKFKQELKKRPQPFTLVEMQRILDTFRSQHPYYADFVEFRFSTGIRTGELIALEWGDISDDFATVTIVRSFNSSTQELKPVKKEKIRSYTLPDNIATLLQRRGRSLPTDLVFPAFQEGYLSARNFSKRQWKPVLASLGIDYRRPYNTRHTLASHALKQGMSAVDLASILGNTPRTIYERYAGEIGKVKPPKLFD